MLQKEDYNYYKTGKGGNETWTLHTYIKLPKRPTPDFPSQFKLPTNNMIHHHRHSIHPHPVTTESLFCSDLFPISPPNFVPKGVQQVKISNLYWRIHSNPMGFPNLFIRLAAKRGIRKQIQDKDQIKKRKRC